MYSFVSSVAMTTGQGLLWVSTAARLHDGNGHTKPSGNSSTASTILQYLSGAWAHGLTTRRLWFLVPESQRLETEAGKLPALSSEALCLKRKGWGPVRWPRHLPLKSSNLSLNPGTHIKVERKGGWRDGLGVEIAYCYTRCVSLSK